MVGGKVKSSFIVIFSIILISFSIYALRVIIVELRNINEVKYLEKKLADIVPDMYEKLPALPENAIKNYLLQSGFNEYAANKLSKAIKHTDKSKCIVNKVFSDYVTNNEYFIVILNISLIDKYYSFNIEFFINRKTKKIVEFDIGY